MALPAAAAPMELAFRVTLAYATISGVVATVLPVWMPAALILR